MLMHETTYDALMFNCPKFRFYLLIVHDPDLMVKILGLQAKQNQIIYDPNSQSGTDQ
jgi:hypothetical protein